jgi:hypothetical protein
MVRDGETKRTALASEVDDGEGVFLERGGVLGALKRRRGIHGVAA